MNGQESATSVLRVRVAVAMILMSALLAGCAASPTSTGNGDSFSNAPKLQATATTGVIRGIVVDEAIRPLANATITARGPEGTNRTAVTGADGFFGFADVVPGSWFVGARKTAYATTQQNVDVVAGVADPPITKIQMVFIPGKVPFVNSFKYDVFVECIIPGANMCAILNLYPCVFLNYCNNLTSDTSFVLFYEQVVALQRNPDWLQTEIVWETTQAVSEGLGIRYSAHEPADGTGIDDRVDSAAGRSPIIITLDHNKTAVWDTGTKKGIGYEIFGWTDALAPLGSLGFVINQRVSFYFNVFYGYTPPDGWTFSGDGTIPPPPQ